jgi:hypothetical protein
MLKSGIPDGVIILLTAQETSAIEISSNLLPILSAGAYTSTFY